MSDGMNEVTALRRERELREDAEQENRKLRESEQRLKAAVATAKLGQWTLDLRSQAMTCSDTCKANYGRGPGETFTYDDLRQAVHPDDLDRVRQAIRQAIETRTDFDTEYRNVWPDSSVHWVLVRGRTEYAIDGTPLIMTGITLDITDRKRAEQQLQISEVRYRALFDAMDEGFVVIEVEFDSSGRAIDYRHVEANPAFEKHTGLQGHLGLSVRQTVPHLEEFWFTTYGRVASTGEPIRFEHKAEPLDGRWFEVCASRLGESGSNRVAVLFTDITVRKEAEETVRASEARSSFMVTLADTLRPLSDPVAVQAEASRVLGERLGANRVVYFEVRGDAYVVERDYAHNVSSVVGRHTIVSFGPDQLATYKSGRTAVEADVNAFPFRPAEEKEAFAGVQIQSYIGVPLVKDGVFVAGLAVHSDRVRTWTPTEIAMTEETAERTWAAVERARAEAEVARIAADAERERRLFGAVLSNTPDLIYTFDLEGRFVYVNTPLLALWGKRMDDVIGRSFRDLEYPPALSERLQEQIHQVIATAQPVRDEMPHAGVAGEQNYEYILVPVLGANGAVEAVAGSARDITDRKRVAEELKEADRRKDEFLATLAHELRNPLAPIRNGLQILQLRGATSEMTGNVIGMMERQLGQMVHLIDDLLDLSRISRGMIELRKDRVELVKAIEQAVETSRPLIESSGHDLTITVPPDKIYVDADVTRLAQVFSNLLNNAAKYTDRCGRLQLVVRRQGDEVVVSVKDNGMGIPGSMLPKVFEMFTQVDRHLERSQGGLGIGLSIVKRLVEMHGGSVNVESDGPGMGSEFTIRLPMVSTAEQQKDSDEETMHLSGGRRVLVVDDNVDAAMSLAMMLKLMGNETKTAYDGLEALDTAAIYRPDLILLDIGMPRLNGHETAMRIREQPWGKKVVLVALTGWGQDEDRRKSREAGFDVHMVKPIEPAALKNLMSGFHKNTT